MRTQSDFINILRNYKQQNAARFGIIRMGIFGSVARNEYNEESDVDVCVESLTPDLFFFVHIKEDLQKLFGCPVDVIRLRDRMDQGLKQRIEKEMIYV